MMGKSILLRSLLCGVVLLYCAQWVHAHGFLQLPASRNYIANKQGREFCHHCLSAGGPFVVQSLTPGGLFPQTETSKSAVRSSLCGESASIPASSRAYNPAPVPQLSSLPVYSPGQEFDMEVVITAHHRGHFEFRLCDASTLSDPRTVTWACLSQHLLQRVSVPGEISPVDVNHPDRYYAEPECAPGYNKTMKMRYRMPSTITCERCVMQWWWVTANSCNPPGYHNRSPQPDHVASGCQWWQSNLPACGQTYPEEFWNCADVRVVGTTTGTEPAVTRDEPAPAVAPAQIAPAVPETVEVPPPAVPVSVPPPPPPTVPVAPGNCRPCVAADGPQCTHFGTASQLWCTQNCPTGVNTAQCPATHCFCSSESVAPATPEPVAPPPATPVAPPPATPVAPPPATPLAPPPTKPVAAPTKPAPAPTGASCSALGWQCGGQGWTGSKCCSQGSCMAYIATYSQCRLDCPPGWLCQYQDKSMLTQAVDWVKSQLA